MGDERTRLDSQSVFVVFLFHQLYLAPDTTHLAYGLF